MKRTKLIAGVTTVVLLAAAAVGYWGWYANQKRVSSLESQLEELQKKERRSAVLQSVSSQMEEIAF